MENYELQVALNSCVNYANREYDSLRKKRERMFKFVIDSLTLKNKVYFCTFTFNNDYLENNNFNRKQFVDWLNRNVKLKCRLYADYGDKNGRFHLHGFCSTQRIIKKDSLSHKELSYFGHTRFILINNKKNDDIYNLVKYAVDYSVKENIKFKMIRVEPKVCK